jgi:hypothetical protein
MSIREAEKNLIKNVQENPQMQRKQCEEIHREVILMVRKFCGTSILAYLKKHGVKRLQFIFDTVGLSTAKHFYK